MNDMKGVDLPLMSSDIEGRFTCLKIITMIVGIVDFRLMIPSLLGSYLLKKGASGWPHTSRRLPQHDILQRGIS